MLNDILGLGLESSCDETSASVVRNGGEVRSNIISSQVDLHRAYYGVVPEIASRAHLETINLLIAEALLKAGATFGDLDYVAATSRPGLVGSLLIGLQTAKVISYVREIPLVGINHLEAHLYAPFLEGREIRYPFIGLLVSGGNTVLYHAHGLGDLEILGRTADDAAGEAFDKIAKYLDLGYPGGPVIEQLARKSVRRTNIFPRILPEPGDMRFSYSGIKTAVINYVKDHPGDDAAAIVYAFQERVLDLLVRRVFAAARSRGVSTIIVAGGVAANGRLRDMLEAERRTGEEMILSSPALCADNAAMVAGLGYHYYMAGRVDELSIDVHARA
jgi:N6-L-threonylcarbamoyladenine synthase